MARCGFLRLNPCMAHESTKAVIIAITSNGIVTLLKFGAATVTGSASMMNEAVHSLMDTMNQGFLYRGLKAAEAPADETYAFGHAQKKYLWNLWSAIGLFSIGSGLGLAHAWHAWHGTAATGTASGLMIGGLVLSPVMVSISVLGIATLLEGFSFLVAMRQFLADMHEDGFTNPFSYLGASDDPTLTAIVLEDSVAMLGLAFAALGVGLAAVTGDERWDIGFSVLIAVMLGFIAIFLGMINMRYLADARDRRAEQVFADVVTQHPEVERYHDLRSIILDDEHTILVAEIELREEAVLTGLQEKIDRHEQAMREITHHEKLEQQSVQQYIHTRAIVQATVERTEEIIEELEAAAKHSLPRIDHITIEIEGIATPPTPATGDA